MKYSEITELFTAENLTYLRSLQQDELYQQLIVLTQSCPRQLTKDIVLNPLPKKFTFCKLYVYILSYLCFDLFVQLPLYDGLHEDFLSYICYLPVSYHPCLASSGDYFLSNVPNLSKDVQTLSVSAIYTDLYSQHGFGSENTNLFINESRTRVFPLKSDVSAGIKVNLSVTDLLASINKSSSAQSSFFNFSVLPFLSLLFHKFKILFYNDQVCNLLFYIWSAIPHYEQCWETFVLFSFFSILFPDYVKDTSDLAKSCGWGSTINLAMLIETPSLQGRGVNPEDLRADGLRRCDEAGKTIGVPFSAALAESIDFIIKTNFIQNTPSYTYEEHCDKQWQSMANGSHGRSVERHGCLKSSNLKYDGYTNVHKKTVLEFLTDKDMYQLPMDGFVQVTHKIEQGKIRPIYVSDIMSHLRYTYLTDIVQQSSHENRVILNPGAGGVMRLASRFRGLMGKGLTSVGIDYSDFNSQHDMSTIKYLTASLCSYFSIPDDVSHSLIHTWDNISTYYKGEYLGRFTGSLPSGHAMTTIINTILNAAYIHVSNPDLYNKCFSMHVGDDVQLFTTNMSDAIILVNSVMNAGFRLNPAKQSIGNYCAEFLRVCHSPTNSCGYLARAISGFVSGNWTNEAVLDPQQRLNHCISSARTIINRSANPAAYIPIIQNLSIKTKIKFNICRNLLSGTHGLNGSPTFSPCGLYLGYTTKLVDLDANNLTYKKQREKFVSENPGHSTRRYMRTHLTSLEHDVMKNYNVNPAKPMIENSITKDALNTLKRGLLVTIISQSKVPCTQTLISDTFFFKTLTLNVFDRNPILRLLLIGDKRKEILKHLSLLLNMSVRHLTNLLERKDSGYNVFDGFFPYADAAALSSVHQNSFFRSKGYRYFV